MCLILTAWDADPRYRLVIAANRDEFHDRPAAPATFWNDAPGLLAGRDLRAGGTWMGITRGGRFAAITNYAEHREPLPDAPSRGALVAGFLRSTEDPIEHLRTVSIEGDRFAGFTLLNGTLDVLGWYSNRAGDPATVSPGIHGLANALLDSDWPKVERGKARLAEALARTGSASETSEELMRLLEDGREEPFDHGANRDPEELAAQRRSRIFLRHPLYGTRVSTVVLVTRDGQVHFSERSWDRQGEPLTRSDHAFQIEEGT